MTVSKPADGLSTLTIDGGNGTDRVDARHLPTGVTVTFKNVENLNKDADDEVFIKELYESRLEREAAETEVALWKSIQQSQGNQAVVDGIEHSPEARTRMVSGWYQNYLGRSAATNEESGWVNALMQGATDEQIIAGIASSQEFQNRANGMFTAGSESEKFVRALYSLILSRQATTAEVTAWANSLGQIGHQGAALGFLQSREFRDAVVTAFYSSILHRTPDQAGMDGWVSSNQDLNHMRVGFESSGEFFGNG